MGIYYNPVDDIIDGRVGTFINTHDYNDAHAAIAAWASSVRTL